MGYFIKEKFTASDNGQKYWIYSPTIKKVGKNVVFVKGKEKKFITGRR